MTPLSKSENFRIHLDWWGKCWTCVFWLGDRTDVLSVSPCTNPKSPLFNEETHTGGHCKKWDSHDIDVALDALYASEEQRSATYRHK